jgi:sortase A
LGAGVLLIGACGAAYLDTFFYQTIEMIRLVRALDAIAGALPGDPDPTGAASGTAPTCIGRIEVPRIGVSAIIDEGCDPTTLRRAVGHVPGSALPGDVGNMCLAGHRDSFFRSLGDVRDGDLVRITTLEGTFEYVVDSVSVVDANRLEVLDDAPTSTLTLITCYPFHFVGPAPARFIARAARVESTPAQRSVSPPSPTSTSPEVVSDQPESEPVVSSPSAAPVSSRLYSRSRL